MKHFGDITKLKGDELPVVDVITGGSPCQDLSVAGARKGLAGERSGLFMEQIRVIKEMRENDKRNGRTAFMVRPRWMVWENVPGAVSSGTPKGEDFRIVLEETAKVADPDAVIPRPPKGWTKAGCIMGDGWSIAWRIHDAQFWGVPQRRKRISLVADFGGLSAPEILFEREGLSGDSEPCGEAGQETAGAAGDGVECAGCYGLDHVMLSGGTTYQGRGYYDDVSGCLKTQAHGVCAPVGVECASIGVDVYNQEITGEVAASLTAASGGTNTSGPKVLAYGFEPGAAKRLDTENRFVQEKTPTFRANMGDNQTSVIILNDQGGSVIGVSEDVTGALRAEEHGHQPCVYGVSSFGSYKEGTTSLRAQGGDNGGGSENIAIQNAIVRRLTPLECERLQGFPDGWTDIGEWVDSKGKKHKEADSPRYKALGNSIALPFWQWMARRICAQYERTPTMASLFDGIGGFPLVFSRAGVIPVWASEIEEFPIAVTKRHFPEEGD